MECKYADCNREAKAKGWCLGHYQQDYLTGSVGPLRTMQRLHSDAFGRVCTNCKEYQPWDNYYRLPNGAGSEERRRSVCKECHKAKERASRRVDAGS